MRKNKPIILAVIIIINIVVLIATFSSYWNNIITGDIVGFVIVLLFVVNSFILASIFDLLKPIFEALGQIFSGMGGSLGR